MLSFYIILAVLKNGFDTIKEAKYIFSKILESKSTNDAQFVFRHSIAIDNFRNIYVKVNRII